MVTVHSAEERAAQLRPPPPTTAMMQSAANEKPAVPAPLPIHQRNAAADLRKMRRIITEDYSWSLAIVPLLSDLCLQHIVTNFQHKPILEELLPKHQAKVLDKLSTSLPLQITANLIDYEDYWRRCCAERWPVCDTSHYGSSWKRLFLERHLENLIEGFIPDLTDLRPICEVAELSKDYVRKLDLQQLMPPVKLENQKDEEIEEASDAGSDAGGELPSMDHFDFSLIAGSLHDLEELRLVYGVKGCGMNFEWNLFRFTDRDCSLLADTFKTFRKLKVFALQKSKVDDDKARVLIRSLLGHPSLVHLDLSHNQISDRGARAIGKLLNQSQLQTLNLCNNNVRPHGAQAIAHALAKNSTLTTLNLRLNHIGDEGGQALCNALLQNCVLATLHLGSNELSEATATILSQVLTQNPTLRSISLSSNRIGLAGGKQLLEGMSVNRTLLEFDLRLTDVGQESEFFINQVLRANQEQARLQGQPKQTAGSCPDR
ncbi:dynein regulatory complex subunit 5 isoform X2 [Hyperolius riggenbachi]|uniref:dynein regulatory complex subunit 5 isoform X2 n=1 Tax=Hyperolius riggenbachi TaxID=752182 RepID=UPI0035A39DFE